MFQNLTANALGCVERAEGGGHMWAGVCVPCVAVTTEDKKQ